MTPSALSLHFIVPHRGHCEHSSFTHFPSNLSYVILDFFFLLTVNQKKKRKIFGSRVHEQLTRVDVVYGFRCYQTVSLPTDA